MNRHSAESREIVARVASQQYVQDYRTCGGTCQVILTENREKFVKNL
jgi:hypothetical protein